MKFIPAIDLKNGKCVRLEQGKEDSATIFNEDPITQAKFFEKSGCERIHIVDLDAAFGRPNINRDLIIKIRNKTNVSIELGGGIKNEEDVLFWKNKGVDYLIIGSFAIKNKESIFNINNSTQEKIYIALDILNYKIMIKGWEKNSGASIDEIIKFYNSSSIRGFVLTDISRDGMLRGLDINLITDIVSKTKKNFIIGGGLSNYNDISNIQKTNLSNIEGIIAGKSFYSGNIEIKKALKIIKNNA